MNREMRKNRIRSQAMDSKWIDPCSEECISEVFTSEARLSKIQYPKKVAELFAKEADVFAKDYGLETVIGTNKKSIPDFDDDVHFQYMSAVDDYQRRLDDGDDAVAVFIKEKAMVIAFGTACKENHETNIDVIEVEINSTRRAGLLKKIAIENLSFEIGVGHIIVLRLLESCRIPIRADATNAQSRYILKSFGFVQDENTENPCILRKVE